MFNIKYLCFDIPNFATVKRVKLIIWKISAGCGRGGVLAVVVAVIGAAALSMWDCRRCVRDWWPLLGVGWFVVVVTVWPWVVWL